jgi:hypothetical protein
LCETDLDLGIECSAYAEFVRIEEDRWFRASAELPDKSAPEVLFEPFDPGEVVVMAVADKDICDVIGNVRHRYSDDLSDKV